MPTKKQLPEEIVVVPLASQPLLLTIPEAARALSATTWAVRNLLWSKQVPFIRIGRRFLIDPSDLRAFIERQKREAA